MIETIDNPGFNANLHCKARVPGGTSFRRAPIIEMLNIRFLLTFHFHGIFIPRRDTRLGSASILLYCTLKTESDARPPKQTSRPLCMAMQKPTNNQIAWSCVYSRGLFPDRFAKPWRTCKNMLMKMTTVHRSKSSTTVEERKKAIERIMEWWTDEDQSIALVNHSVYWSLWGITR